jgi:hypothetical protein
MYWLALTANVKSSGVWRSQFSTAEGRASR